MRVFSALVLSSFILLFSCTDSQKKHKNLIIFHAGSLSVPMKELVSKYQEKNPDVSILTEAAGSLVCARKVTELNKPCDIVASADYYVINELLIPKFADWGIKFASNQIVIAFTDRSRYSADIDSVNWKDILLKNDVVFSRSDPNSDPCGYRSVITLELAEKYYNSPGLAEKFISKNKEYIRPKEVDLVALLESNTIDYMFQYKSVAIQHNLKYIALPAKISLSDPAYNDFYRSVSVDVTGSTPGSTMKVTGEYINYSVTVLNNAPQKAEALKFVAFMLGDEGQNIFRKNGQEPLIPSMSDQADKVPSVLQNYLKN